MPLRGSLRSALAGQFLDCAGAARLRSEEGLGGVSGEHEAIRCMSVREG